MDRALRIWSAVSWWLVPLAILAMGAVDLAQNGSLSSEGGSVTFPGPAVAHAGFLLLVTVPLCWRFRASATVAVVVTVVADAWVLVMFSAKAQPGLRRQPVRGGRRRNYGQAGPDGQVCTVSYLSHRYSSSGVASPTKSCRAISGSLWRVSSVNSACLAWGGLRLSPPAGRWPSSPPRQAIGDLVVRRIQEPPRCVVGQRHLKGSSTPAATAAAPLKASSPGSPRPFWP